mgnify:CR=1 FL=1
MWHWPSSGLMVSCRIYEIGRALLRVDQCLSVLQLLWYHGFCCSRICSSRCAGPAEKMLRIVHSRKLHPLRKWIQCIRSGRSGIYRIEGSQGIRRDTANFILPVLSLQRTISRTVVLCMVLSEFYACNVLSINSFMDARLLMA